MFKTTLAIAALTVAAFASTAIAEGRAPTDAEAAAIGTALQGAGYSKWANVELDDGKWEVDNAVHADGKIYDVDLRVADLAVIKKDLED